jgi:23S rRNA pseudouridine2604 synthase
MRINRFFTDQGICSRRKADDLVRDGRVTINGRRAELGDQVEDGDSVELDGRVIEAKAKAPVVLAYNKPRGVECTSDPEVPDNIIAAVNYPERVYTVGRLDKYSEGLILLTNVGEVANQLTRARFGHEKEYTVELTRDITNEEIALLENGVEIEDTTGALRKTAPCRIRRMDSKTVRMILIEGRNRQIRRMLEVIGAGVARLRRIRIGKLELRDLPLGQWRALGKHELALLLPELETRRPKPGGSQSSRRPSSRVR